MKELKLCLKAHSTQSNVRISYQTRENSFYKEIVFLHRQRVEVNKYYLVERGSGNLNLLGSRQNVNICMKYLFSRELIKSTIEVIEQKIDSYDVCYERYSFARFRENKQFFFLN